MGCGPGLEAVELLLIPLGFAVGAFGALVGAGGGFVLVPILLLLYPDDDPQSITAISLFVVCANAISGALAFAAQKRIDYASGLWFTAGTFPGAIVGAVAVGYVPRRGFDAIFAITLCVLGVYLALRSNRQAIHEPVTGRGVVRRLITDRYGNTFAYSFQLWKGVILSGAIGFVSSFLGIGGGVVHVPTMTTILHFPVHIATATSFFVLTFMSAEGTVVHLSTGALAEGFDKAVLLAIGAVPGAQAGAYLSRRVHSTVITRSLAGSLVVVGTRLGLKAANIW